MGKARGSISQNIKQDTLRFVLAVFGTVGLLGFGVYLYRTGELMNGMGTKYFTTLLIYIMMVYKIITGRMKRRYVGITDEVIEQNFGFALGNYFADGPLKKGVYRAIRLMFNQEFEKAAKLLKKLERKCSSKGEESAVLYLIGHCALKEDKTDEAMIYMEQASKLRPGFVRALLALAKLNQAKQHNETAYRYIMEAKEWEPENEEVWESLTIHYFRTVQLENAMDTARYWESIAPKSGDAASYICAVAAFMGDFELAEDYCRRSETLGYDNVKALKKIIEDKKRKREN